MAMTKDPRATLDYGVDWTAWLDGDTITNSTWTVEDGLEMAQAAHTTTHTTVWLRGGTRDQVYTVTNTITTAKGRTDVRSFVVRVRNR